MHISYAATLFAFIIVIFASSRSAPAAPNITPYDEKGAVIYAYHRIGEDGFPDSNLRTELFEAHVREILAGEYNVMPLPEIVSAIADEKVLPPRTIAITFEGGHRSILDKAVPLLLKHELPFTVFIATDKADLNLSEYLNWSDIKKLGRHKNVTIGIHPASYTRLANESRKETSQQINKAKNRYREIFGENPSFFAYPFGEYSLAYRDIVAASGFVAAFGQQSGVAWPGGDFFAIPRFNMTDSVADIDRFQLTANALPLPIFDVEPKDTEISARLPAIGFTVDQSLEQDLPNLSCFSSILGNPVIEIIGTRVEIRHDKDTVLDQSRIRINCTIPAQSEPDSVPRWRWFGLLMNIDESVDSIGTLPATVPRHDKEFSEESVPPRQNLNMITGQLALP